MTRATLIRFGIATLLLGGLGVAPVAPAGDQDADRLKDLSGKVDQLEEKNAALTKENTRLKEQIHRLEGQLAAAQVAHPLGQPKVPGNWTERQFNGITYYLVPLDGGRAEQKPVLIAK